MAAEDALTQGDGAAKRVILKAKLDLKASEELVSELLALRGHDVELDASDVDHLGGHAAQTLMIAAKSWRTDGHKMCFSDLSDAAAENLKNLGLDQSFLDGERKTA